MQQIVQSGPLLNDSHITFLKIGYTADDVKEALLSIDGTKAPGVDSFGAQYEYIGSCWGGYHSSYARFFRNRRSSLKR